MAIVQLLESLKHTNNKDLFVVKFSEDVEIIFCLLPIKQAFQIAKILQTLEDPTFEQYVYRYIFNQCVTDDCLAKNNNKLPAGIETSIANVILFLCGVTRDSVEYTENLLELYRDNLNTITSAMKRCICTAYSGYTFAKLDALNYQELVEIFANAEQSLIERGIMESKLKISVPGEDEQQSIGDMIQSDSKEYETFNKEQPKKKINPIELDKLRKQRLRQQRQNRGG